MSGEMLAPTTADREIGKFPTRAISPRVHAENMRKRFLHLGHPVGLPEPYDPGLHRITKYYDRRARLLIEQGVIGQGELTKLFTEEELWQHAWVYDYGYGPIADPTEYWIIEKQICRNKKLELRDWVDEQTEKRLKDLKQLDYQTIKTASAPGESLKYRVFVARDDEGNLIGQDDPDFEYWREENLDTLYKRATDMNVTLVNRETARGAFRGPPYGEVRKQGDEGAYLPEVRANTGFANNDLISYQAVKKLHQLDVIDWNITRNDKLIGIPEPVQRFARRYATAVNSDGKTVPFNITDYNLMNLPANRVKFEAIKQAYEAEGGRYRRTLILGSHFIDVGPPGMSDEQRYSYMPSQYTNYMKYPQGEEGQGITTFLPLEHVVSLWQKGRISNENYYRWMEFPPVLKDAGIDFSFEKMMQEMQKTVDNCPIWSEKTTWDQSELKKFFGVNIRGVGDPEHNVQKYLFGVLEVVNDMADLGGMSSLNFADRGSLEMALNRITDGDMVLAVQLANKYFHEARGNWELNPRAIPAPIRQYLMPTRGIDKFADISSDNIKDLCRSLNRSGNEVKTLLAAQFGLNIGDRLNLFSFKGRDAIALGRKRISRLSNEWDMYLVSMGKTIDDLGAFGKMRGVKNKNLITQMLSRRKESIVAKAGKPVGWMERTRMLTHNFFSWIIEMELSPDNEYSMSFGGMSEREKIQRALEFLKMSMPMEDQITVEFRNEKIKQMFGLAYDLSTEKWLASRLIYSLRVPFPSALIGLLSTLTSKPASLEKLQSFCENRLDVSAASFLITSGILLGMGQIPALQTVDIKSIFLALGTPTLTLTGVSAVSNYILPKIFRLYPIEMYKGKSG